MSDHALTPARLNLEQIVSLEAERAVLGGVLIKPAAFQVVKGTLAGVDDLFLPAHRFIYEAMEAIVSRRQELDVIAIGDELKQRDRLRTLEGGESYLLTIANNVPTAENIGVYARIVAEKALLRRLVISCAELTHAAHGEVESATALVSEAARKILGLRFGGLDRSEALSVTAQRILDDLEAVDTGRRSIPRVPTGIVQLDHRLRGGLRPGLTVPLGLTGMGKSSFALQTAARAAAQGVPTLVFELEDDRDEAFKIMAANLSKTPASELDYGGRRDLDAWKRVNRTVGRLAELENVLEISDMRQLDGIVARTVAWRTEHPEDRALVVVDHIQKVQVRSQKGRTREQEVSLIASTLQNMGKDLRVAVIAPSQMDNDANKENRPPRLGDSRESKAIEHEAPLVIGINRDRSEDAGDAELIVLKARKGVPGSVKVQWKGAWQGFENEDNWYVDRRFSDND